MPKREPIVFDTTAKPTIWNFRDLSGKTFARLTVLAFAGMRKQRSYWRCGCQCGVERIITASALNSGKTKSCGCLQAEITTSRNLTEMVRHGESYPPSPEYSVWNSMKMRCSNPKNNKYYLYGARGVTVCDRWANSFESFVADMGRRPTLKHTIDRYPNPDGNYEPGNCRWATYYEQRHNRRDSVRLHTGDQP